MSVTYRVWIMVEETDTQTGETMSCGDPFEGGTFETEDAAWKQAGLLSRYADTCGEEE